MAVAVLAVAAAVAVIAAVAAPRTGIGLHRDGDTNVWLGRTARVTLTVANTSGRAMWLSLRDSWVPSAGTGNTEHRLRLPAGAAEAVVTTLTPTRHGDR